MNEYEDALYRRVAQTVTRRLSVAAMLQSGNPDGRTLYYCPFCGTLLAQTVAYQTLVPRFGEMTHECKVVTTESVGAYSIVAPSLEGPYTVARAFDLATKEIDNRIAITYTSDGVKVEEVKSELCPNPDQVRFEMLEFDEGGA